ncbi:hypothetical protein HDU97_003381 [Phlyctochytrium planicorne]|nr:hypothetical protein HDU97_003381 [Phlyctochytrium planicorne]
MKTLEELIPREEREEEEGKAATTTVRSEAPMSRLDILAQLKLEQMKLTERGGFESENRFDNVGTVNMDEESTEAVEDEHEHTVISEFPIMKDSTYPTAHDMTPGPFPAPHRMMRGVVRGGSPFPSPTLQRRIVSIAQIMNQGKEADRFKSLATEPLVSRFARGSASGSLMPALDRPDPTNDVEMMDTDRASSRSGSSSPVPIPAGGRNEKSCGKSPICLHRRSPLSQSSQWANNETSDNDEEDDAPMNFDDPAQHGLRSPSTPQAFNYSSQDHSTPFSFTKPHSIRQSPLFHPTSPSSFSEQPFGSLVGSYEESLLSGRMSTLPSRPITFLAEIGAIGFGKVKSKLKCPPHVNLAFPAYFYDLLDDETPTSPYVGVIDIQGLQGLVLRKDNGTGTPSLSPHESDCEDANDFRKKWRGGYRLPHHGQIQIIIKNPAKTAVKLFLIPYDFREMPPNTKTFLRQKLYSAGTPATPNHNSNNRRNSTSTLSSRLSIPSLRDSNLGKSPSKDRSNRLRDAIHLQFWCDAKRRLYLTRSIRVVFSHRAPDSDEKLTTTCEGPENPRFVPCESPMKVKKVAPLTLGVPPSVMAFRHTHPPAFPHLGSETSGKHFLETVEADSPRVFGSEETLADRKEASSQFGISPAASFTFPYAGASDGYFNGLDAAMKTGR